MYLSRKYFYPIVPDFGCYKKQYKDVELPVARNIGKRILCLPLYNGLTEEEIDFVVEKIKECQTSKVK